MNGLRLVGNIISTMIVIVGSIWYFYSPDWAVDSFIKDARNGHIEKLIEATDFDRLRTSVKDDWRPLATQLMNAFGGEEIPGLAMAAFDAQVDAEVTPAKVRALFAKTPKLANGQWAQALEGGYITRDSFDRFSLHLKSGATVTFARVGVSWKVAGLQISTAILSKLIANAANNQQTATASSVPSDTLTSASNDNEDPTKGGTEIPAQFHGLWAPDAAACSDDDGVDRIGIDAKSYEAWEAHGQVDSVKIGDNPEQYIVKYSFDGLGEKWKVTGSLQLDGAELIDGTLDEHGNAVAAPPKLIRCQ